MIKEPTMVEPTFTTYDYPIGGKMVVGSFVVTEMEALNLLNSDHKPTMKRKLLYQMVDYMLDNNLAEFTTFEDHARGTRTFRVRAYLAPNDQVKILRVAYKID